MMGDLAAGSISTEAELSAEAQQVFEGVAQALQRDVNILADSASSRASKKRSLDHIKNETLGKLHVAQNPVLVRRVLEIVCKPLIRCLNDSVESCREASVGLLISFAEQVDTVIPLLQYIVPSIASRLDQPEFAEPAEEIRLLLVTALTRLVDITKGGFNPFVEDVVKVLQRTFQDPFPDVKKESCKLVMGLCSHCPRALAYHGATVAKSILPSLHHRHSTVRTLGIQAMRDVLLVDASALDDILDPLKQLTLDKSQSVRECLYKTAGEWLLRLPDRWSIGYKILPLLLAGMTDDVGNSATLCRTYMDEIGALYEREWEDRLKDELDYVQQGIPTDRPRVGARHVARDFTQKTINSCLEGLSDWNAEVRVKSAQILRTFAYYAEENVTGYLGTILPVFNKVLAADEPDVIREVLAAAEVLGSYVNPTVYLDVVGPALRSGAGGATQYRIGCLKALGALLRGTPPSRFDTVRLQTLIGLVSDRELIHNENTKLLAEVASAVAEIVKLIPAAKAAGGNHDAAAQEKAAFELFIMTAQLISVEGNEQVPGVSEVRQKGAQALTTLSTASGLFSIQDLYAHYLEQSLRLLVLSEPSWTRHSPEMRLLRTITVAAGPAVGKQLHLIVPLFARLTALERDSELRDATFDLLLTLLETRPTPLNSTLDLPHHSTPLLSDTILKSSVWKPGRRATALRSKAIKTLVALLQQPPTDGCLGALTIDSVKAAWELLLNVLCSCLEDDEVETRGGTLGVCRILLDGDLFDAPSLKKLYPELLKRMDDARDDIRIQTAKTFAHFFTAATLFSARMQPYTSTSPPGVTSVLVDAHGKVVDRDAGEGARLVEVRLDDVHWVAVVKGLVVHMDDVNPVLQESIFKALQTGTSTIPATILREHLTAVRGRHRSPQYIDALLALLP
ncbi:armadillo-type protein [Fimicolochytrium jonesii]|uniref:armadillo-type protein n=1 Tax=Fimicolochytrium jonesii TaxID=1396493 RepID=UPI0022FE398B|nr:armadillo-type protein [Fimicolochytrium jonesii]KAI8825196.1 armadillo-type protein [Fimicolochytrium jonesii]